MYGEDADPIGMSDLSLCDWTPGVWHLPYTQSMFERHRKARRPNPQTVDAERLLALFGSIGWIASLPGQDRRPLVERMRLRLTATSYVLPGRGGSTGRGSSAMDHESPG